MMTSHIKTQTNIPDFSNCDFKTEMTESFNIHFKKCKFKDNTGHSHWQAAFTPGFIPLHL